MKALRGQQALLTGDRDLGKDCKWMDGIKFLTLKGREESSVEDGLKGRAVKAWACLMPKSWGLRAKAWAWQSRTALNATEAWLDLVKLS